MSATHWHEMPETEGGRGKGERQITVFVPIQVREKLVVVHALRCVRRSPYLLFHRHELAYLKPSRGQAQVVVGDPELRN